LKTVLVAVLLVVPVVIVVGAWVHRHERTYVRVATTATTEHHNWLHTVFGGKNAVWMGGSQPHWKVWLYQDPVTQRVLLLPSEPHAITAEPRVLSLFNQLTCPGLFVDVGMNSGFYSLLARVRGCRVLAVEIQPSCVAMRFAERANFVADVEIVQAPISAQPGQLVKVNTERMCEGMMSLFWRGDTEMRSTSLDALLPQSKGAVSMMKIDIEGFEPYAIAGSKALFASKRIAAVIMEATWWPNVFQPVVRAYQEIAFVFDLGYTMQCLDSTMRFTSAQDWLAHGASELASRALKDDPEARRVSSCDNYLICREPCDFA